MTRFKVTVRDADIELRGYIDGAHVLRDVADRMKPTPVIASAAQDNYSPFLITEPEFPPTPELSMEHINSLSIACESLDEFISQVAMLHFAQANVIRHERYLRDAAEAELRDRELHHFEVEQENANLKAEITRLKTEQDEYTRMMVGRVDDAEQENTDLKAALAERESD